MAARINVYQDHVGRWRFRVVTHDGETIAESVKSYRRTSEARIAGQDMQAAVSAIGARQVRNPQQPADGPIPVWPLPEGTPLVQSFGELDPSKYQPASHGPADPEPGKCPFGRIVLGEDNKPEAGYLCDLDAGHPGDHDWQLELES